MRLKDIIDTKSHGMTNYNCVRMAVISSVPWVCTILLCIHVPHACMLTSNTALYSIGGGNVPTRNWINRFSLCLRAGTLIILNMKLIKQDVCGNRSIEISHQYSKLNHTSILKDSKSEQMFKWCTRTDYKRKVDLTECFWRMTIAVGIKVTGYKINVIPR